MFTPEGTHISRDRYCNLVTIGLYFHKAILQKSPKHCMKTPVSSITYFSLYGIYTIVQSHKVLRTMKLHCNSNTARSKTGRAWTLVEKTEGKQLQSTLRWQYLTPERMFVMTKLPFRQSKFPSSCKRWNHPPAMPIPSKCQFLPICVSLATVFF